MKRPNSLDLAKAIRVSSLEMVHRSKSSHIGSALSIADILAVLFAQSLKFDPEDAELSSRDRFILSKGHACAALYAVLAHAGFFELKTLETFGQEGSNLMTHVSHKVPGVEFSTGSLGHGLPFAVGKAYAAKLQGLDWRVYVLVGDGELNEGSNWEALMFAAHHKLSNLTVIIDGNNLQSLASADDTLNMRPYKEKFESFGTHYIQIDGHDHVEFFRSFSESSGLSPKVIYANTTKGKGVSFMENQVSWHYKNPNDEEFWLALNEIVRQA